MLSLIIQHIWTIKKVVFAHDGDTFTTTSLWNITYDVQRSVNYEIEISDGHSGLLWKQRCRGWAALSVSRLPKLCRPHESWKAIVCLSVFHCLTPTHLPHKEAPTSQRCWHITCDINSGRQILIRPPSTSGSWLSLSCASLGTFLYSHWSDVLLEQVLSKLVFTPCQFRNVNDWPERGAMTTEQVWDGSTTAVAAGLAVALIVGHAGLESVQRRDLVVVNSCGVW